MIESVKQIQTMKACDLPHTFDILVGQTVYPFEIVDADNHFMYLRDIKGNEIVNVPNDYMMTVLIPDTLDNAKWDISLSLMQDGLL
jgi:hypothetical protein